MNDCSDDILHSDSSLNTLWTVGDFLMNSSSLRGASFISFAEDLTRMFPKSTERYIYQGQHIFAQYAKTLSGQYSRTVAQTSSDNSVALNITKTGSVVKDVKVAILIGTDGAVSEFDADLQLNPPSPDGNTSVVVYYTGYLSMITSLVYVSYRAGNKTTDAELIIEFQHSAHTVEKSAICAHTAAESDMKRWFADKCRTTEAETETNEVGNTKRVKCQCRGTGFFAVFARTLPTMNSGHVDTITAPVEYEQIFSKVFGFPYSRELYLAGQVLRAISLVCLVLTIVSFTIFRNQRKGIPSNILVHLCVSLIVLLVVLYIGEELGGTRIGCRVANVFRYYLILVSLIWNGVEAHNMYRMLVKVFTGDRSHFVLKSAILAWGLPGVLVAVAHMFSVRAFNGVYDEDCKFRCSLRSEMLYYGWLLPMSIIIVHNLVVFGLVVRVFFQTNDPVQSSRVERRDHWTRLCGACTVLVLLGVPWIFSAFGVIDPQKNTDLQTFEQVINGAFTVSVNIQGMFIFGFHCLRIKSVRDNWTSIVTSSNATFSSSQKNSTRQTTNSASDAKVSVRKRDLGIEEELVETKIP